MIQLCQRDWHILTFIAQYMATHRIAPSLREISEGVGINSTNVISYHLAAMEADGLLTRQPNAARTIVLRSQSVGVAV